MCTRKRETATRVVSRRVISLLLLCAVTQAVGCDLGRSLGMFAGDVLGGMAAGFAEATGVSLTGEYEDSDKYLIEDYVAEEPYENKEGRSGPRTFWSRTEG